MIGDSIQLIICFVENNSLNLKENSLFGHVEQLYSYHNKKRLDSNGIFKTHI